MRGPPFVVLTSSLFPKLALDRRIPNPPSTRTYTNTEQLGAMSRGAATVAAVLVVLLQLLGAAQAFLLPASAHPRCACVGFVNGVGAPICSMRSA
jgi:hypothetical protein